MQELFQATKDKVMESYNYVKENGMTLPVMFPVLLSLGFGGIAMLIVTISLVSLGIDLIGGTYGNGFSLTMGFLMFVILMSACGIVAGIMLPNYTYKVYRDIVEQNKAPEYKNFLKEGFKGSLGFFLKFLLNVILPLILVSLIIVPVGVLIPLIGAILQNIILNVCVMILTFRFFANLIGKKYNKIIDETKQYWLLVGVGLGVLSCIPVLSMLVGPLSFLVQFHFIYHLIKTENTLVVEQ